MKGHTLTMTINIIYTYVLRTEKQKFGTVKVFKEKYCGKVKTNVFEFRPHVCLKFGIYTWVVCKLSDLMTATIQDIFFTFLHSVFKFYSLLPTMHNANAKLQNKIRQFLLTNLHVVVENFSHCLVYKTLQMSKTHKL